MIGRVSLFRALAMLTVLGLVLSVSACGRRGPLEPPPSAVVTAPTGQAVVVPVDPTDATPAARRRIPLDVILD